MSKRLELLRELHKARREEKLQLFVEGLSEEDLALIEPNIQGTTAHRVSSTLVTHSRSCKNSSNRKITSK